ERKLHEFFYKNEVARVLFGAEPEYRSLVSQSFVEAAQTIDLTQLNLSGTGFNDVGPLAALANLQVLRLSGTGVSDVGPLVSLAKLRDLRLHGTKVSQTELARLKAALPECRILHD